MKNIHRDFTANYVLLGLFKPQKQLDVPKVNLFSGSVQYKPKYSKLIQSSKHI